MSNTRALTGLAVIVLVIAGTPLLLYFYGLPWIAGLAARAVPVSWEEEVGQLTAAQISGEMRTCRSREARDVLDRVIAAAPDSPYHFEVRLIDSPEPNAFAAPGGRIVVFRGLLEQMRSPDELAAVLAHEAQHVLHRHTTRGLIRQAALAFVIAYLAGDAAGMLSLAAEALGGLHYQRSDETEADRDGVDLLVRARIDPRAMISMLERLRDATAGQPQLPAWASTHPDLEQRLAGLQRRIPQAWGTRPALSADRWETLRNACAAAVRYHDIR